MINKYVEWCNSPTGSMLSDLLFAINSIALTISIIIMFQKDKCIFRETNEDKEDRTKCNECIFLYKCSRKTKIKHSETIARIELDELLSKDGDYDE